VSRIESAVAPMSRQDALYNDAAAQFSQALTRLAESTAYEFDPEKRRDLLQELHFPSGGASPLMTTGAPFALGPIGLPTTRQPPTSSGNSEFKPRSSVSKSWATFLVTTEAIPQSTSAMRPSAS
jgi:hypothetical protein